MQDSKNRPTRQSAPKVSKPSAKPTGTYGSRIVSETINVACKLVYEYARQMENLPNWASGLATGIQQENGHWFTDSPMGKVQVDMAPRNDFGVLDHDVTLPDGTVVHNAFRVTPAGDGCVVSFVVLRLPGVSIKDLAKDVGHVANDLKALKAILEKAYPALTLT